jgi:hypothetical protein
VPFRARGSNGRYMHIGEIRMSTKKIIIILIIFSTFLAIPVIAQHSPLIEFINGQQINLGETTISQLTEKIGSPNSSQYFEYGGEDFFWNDFYYYEFENSKIKFHVDSTTKKIFRITLKMDELTNIQNQIINLYEENRESIPVYLSTFETQNQYQSKDYISFELHGQSLYGPITIGLWLNDDKNIMKWAQPSRQNLLPV